MFRGSETWFKPAAGGGGSFINPPASDNATDLGSSAFQWRKVFTRKVESSGALVLASNSLDRFSLDASGNLVQDGTNGGDIVFSKSAGLIRQGTSDAADTLALRLSGGGGYDAAGGRGGVIELQGNEAGGTYGTVRIGSGSTAFSSISLRINNDVSTSQGGVFIQNSSAATLWQFRRDGTLNKDATNGGDIVFNGTTNNNIRQGTSDGADNSFINICGGGAAQFDGSRGALVSLSGEQNGGAADIVGGAINTGHIRFRLNGSTAEVQVNNSSGANLWAFSQAGALTQNATNGGNIVFSKASTGIIIANTTSIGLQTGQQLRLYNGASGATKPTNTQLEVETAANGGVNISNTSVNTSGYYFSNPTAAWDGGIEYGNASRALTLRAANASRFSITSAGNLIQDGTNGGDIVLQKTGSSIQKPQTLSISAAGTTQGTATALTNTVNQITTCAAGAGVVLKSAAVGQEQVVANTTSNPLLVYPASADNINTLAVNIPIALSPGQVAIFTAIDSTTWIGVIGGSGFQAALEGQLSGTITNGTYVITTKARYAFRIIGIYGLKSTSGTGTLAVQINGVSVTGLSALAVTSSAQDVTASGANSVAISDQVTFVVSSASSLVDIFSTLDIQRV